jgi:hypothetical protein
MTVPVYGTAVVYVPPSGPCYVEIVDRGWKTLLFPGQHGAGSFYADRYVDRYVPGCWDFSVSYNPDGEMLRLSARGEDWCVDIFITNDLNATYRELAKRSARSFPPFDYMALKSVLEFVEHNPPPGYRAVSS